MNNENSKAVSTFVWKYNGAGGYAYYDSHVVEIISFDPIDRGVVFIISGEVAFGNITGHTKHNEEEDLSIDNIKDFTVYDVEYVHNYNVVSSILTQLVITGDYTDAINKLSQLPDVVYNYDDPHMATANAEADGVYVWWVTDTPTLDWQQVSFKEEAYTFVWSRIETDKPSVYVIPNSPPADS